MKLLSSLCLVFWLEVLPSSAQHRRLRQHNTRKLSKQTVWKRSPAPIFVFPSARDIDDGDDQSRQHHRQLLNGGYAFIVSSNTADGKEWCMDALNGVDTGKSLGFRPCAFNIAPSTQLFLPTDDGRIRSKLDWDKCLLVEDGKGDADDGDRVRLGPCSREESKFQFDFGSKVSTNLLKYINREGQLEVKSNPDLCMTYEGNNPDENDRIILTDSCQSNSDNVKFMFRSGYYDLSQGDECVVVRDNIMRSGNRVMWDYCDEAGYSAHWRIDGDGLMHNRLDDRYCMEAKEIEEGAAIRIQRCDKNDEKQRFEWPDGFEGPIQLLVNDDFGIGPQGNSDQPGDVMVLEYGGKGFSGDTVHV